MIRYRCSNGSNRTGCQLNYGVNSMQSVIPPGDASRTVIAGKKQDWRGLAINYGETEDLNHPGILFPTMTTAWEPNEAERAAIAAGASIVVQILATPPINPMCVYVGAVPDPG